MPAVGSRADEVHVQLERILGSSGFARNARLSSLLAYIIRKHLEGKPEELKETVIGVQVFGRRPDYDPHRDSVVRTEAAKLRARLREYYAGEGAADPVIIEIPKGGYAPLPGPRAEACPLPAATADGRPRLWRQSCL
jgi:hypothetical protein